MNEVTKIHLGRQAFAISADAYKALQDYLHAIQRKVGKEVAEEVELRMAELLTERGASGDKVVLSSDIEYLKTQLGEPGDFGDDEAEESADDAAPKRLFRDTENGMVAGVAAGIGKYLGIEVLWIRLLFIVLMLAGASGFLLYIVLWILVPEAKSSSDRLQMQGRSVTVEALKDAVDRADVKGTAKRAQQVVEKGVHGILKVCLALMGIALVIGAVGTLIALTAGSVYLALNHDMLLPFAIFPTTVAETTLAWLVVASIALVAIFLLCAGLAMAKRKWVLPGWALGALVVLFMACLAVGAALAADAVPKIEDRVAAAHHSDVRTLTKPFHEVGVVGAENSSRLVEIERRVGDHYKVELDYMGHADTKGVTVRETTPGVVTVNVEKYKSDPACKNICIFRDRDLKVIVYAPLDQTLTITDTPSTWRSGQDLKMPELMEVIPGVPTHQ